MLALLLRALVIGVAQMMCIERYSSLGGSALVINIDKCYLIATIGNDGN
ncbi:hypothetical protein MWK61_22975 [Escherichia coli]|nr:hypothetical protein [Escherichia coli]